MTIAQIESIITKHIGENNVIDISVTRFGQLNDVNLLYMDGDTLPNNRKWIEQHIPNLWHLSIDRCYSNDAMNQYNLNEDDEKAIEYTHNHLFSVSL